MGCRTAITFGRSLAKSAQTSAELSVEQSSTRTISKSSKVWSSRRGSDLDRNPAELYTGMITLTAGMAFPWVVAVIVPTELGELVRQVMDRGPRANNAVDDVGP